MSVTQQQVNEPWKPAQKYIKFGMGQAQQLYNQGSGFKAYPGRTVAPFSAQTQGALSGIYNTAQAPNELAGASMDALKGIFAGTPGSNPAFEAALNDQSQQTANDVQRQFSGLGRIGSGADTGVLADRIAAGRNTAMANQYNTDIGQRLQAVAAAPGAYQQQYLPYQMQAQVGQAYDTQNQKLIDARVNRFNTNQNAGWNRLGAYNAAIGGGGPTSSTTSQPNNPWGSLLGGALGGASIGNSLFPGTGGVLGALLGGGAGLLSSL